MFVPKIKDLFLDKIDLENFISEAPPVCYSLEEVMMYMHNFGHLSMDDEMLDFIVKTIKINYPLLPVL